jgi:ribosome-binding factor A
MESTRQQKITRLIQKELSEIFRLQTAKTHGVLVSVSTVRISPDLSIAHAYLSIFPSGKSEEIIGNIRKSTMQVRHELAQRVRYQLRKCPELAFHLDDSLDYIDRIDELLKTDKKNEDDAND